MRLILYTRVSTEEQAKAGVSMADQEHRGRAWAAIMGHEIVTVIADEGVSATVAPMERPRFARAVGILEKDEADGIVACALDRISRTTIDTLSLVSMFNARGWSLLSMKESLDTHTPVGEFVVTILAAFAQFERATISARTKDGIAQVKRENRRYSGWIPFGKTLVDGKLIDNEIELEAIRRISDMRTQKVKFKDVVIALNAWHYHPRSAQPWTKTSVDNFIRGMEKRGYEHIRHRQRVKLRRKVKPATA